MKLLLVSSCIVLIACLAVFVQSAPGPFESEKEIRREEHHEKENAKEKEEELKKKKLEEEQEELKKKKKLEEEEEELRKKKKLEEEEVQRHHRVRGVDEAEIEKEIKEEKKCHPGHGEVETLGHEGGGLLGGLLDELGDVVRELLEGLGIEGGHDHGHGILQVETPEGKLKDIVKAIKDALKRRKGKGPRIFGASEIEELNAEAAGAVKKFTSAEKEIKKAGEDLEEGKKEFKEAEKKVSAEHH